jgi:Tol biopolymer transport system component
VVTSPFWGPDGKSFGATRLSSIYKNLDTSELILFYPGGGFGLPLVASPGQYENVHEGQFSPDGRKFYYTLKPPNPNGKPLFQDANHILHVIMQRDMSSGESEQLIGGFGGATTPQVSPDSKQVAFVRRVKTKTVLFVYDLESGEQKPVYDGLDRDMQAEWIPQGSFYPQFGWFPDGRHIAIWGKGKLLKVDTQTATTTDIPFSANADLRVTDVARFPFELAPEEFTVRAIQHLAVAPGKQSIVFSALGYLWQKALPDGKPKRLSDATALEFEPVYAADGKSLAWVQWDDETGSALMLASANGKKPKQLISSPAVIRQPAFSPDGRFIVYQVEEGSKCMGGIRKGMGTYVVPLSGGAPRYITDAGLHPRFSPDGERIFLIKDSYEQDIRLSKLISVDLEGLNLREHAIARGSDRHDLVTSPDLQWIGFKENHQYYVMPLVDAGVPIYIAAQNTTVPVKSLTELGGYSLTWSADSTELNWLLGGDLYQAGVAVSSVTEITSINLMAPSDIPQGKVAFVGARLITQAGDVIEQGTLLVDRNRIAAVGAEGDVTVPANAFVVDAHGKTIMPGLVNMHGHLEDCYYAATGAMPQKQSAYYAALAFGTTTNFDPYASEVPSYTASEMRNAGNLVGPRTISVGSVLFGRPGKYDPVYEPINSLADAEKVMQRKKALGGHLVKSYRQPMRSQRQQIIKAARDAGIMVAVEGESHFYNNISAVLDGHNTVEHNLPVATYYNDILQLFTHSRTASTPTLVVTFGELLGENYIYQHHRNWEDPRIDQFVPYMNSVYSPIGQRYAAPLFARNITSVHVADELWDIGFRSVARSYKKLDDAGVLVNVGSHGQVQGLAMHWEMELFAEGGMANERILRAATINGAKTLALDHEIGSLEVGKLADLIVLGKNPLEDIRNTISV